ncbi:PTS glucitol/sorbitol transporter subunit IIA [Vibrio sp. 10N.261.51.F12]|uniref:PTS glucitol/sorbitol transporter subunit IIA n=1 Tax=Vibrio sp. 10N.261.51.F12 TaxID=3229679 RepID=UPI00354B7537
MSLQFKASITKIGELANDSLEDDMMILFNESAPEDVVDYCFIHNQGAERGTLTTESTLLIGERDYIVTSIGKMATKNLNELGHVTIKFDGRMTPELPGMVHVLGKRPTTISINDAIVFG